jgi:hypothetical protein
MLIHDLFEVLVADHIPPGGPARAWVASVTCGGPPVDDRVVIRLGEVHRPQHVELLTWARNVREHLRRVAA